MIQNVRVAHERSPAVGARVSLEERRHSTKERIIEISRKLVEWLISFRKGKTDRFCCRVAGPAVFWRGLRGEVDLGNDCLPGFWSNERITVGRVPQ